MHLSLQEGSTVPFGCVKSLSIGTETFRLEYAQADLL